MEDSDFDYAFRLQMEEALAASLSSRSRTPQRPPSPPIVARCGVAIIEENDQNESTAKTDSADVRLRNRGYGFDFKKAVGEGNSKGKGKIHETVTGVRRDDQNPNLGVGNFRNTSGNDNTRPSPVLQSQGTVRPAQSVGEGSSRVNAAGGKFNVDVLYRLYFKGLVSEENGKGKLTDVLAGFGVAICDQRDHLLFEMKGPLIDNGLNRQGAELKALIRGLNEALKFGIKHIDICCYSYPIFQYVRGNWVAKQKKISLLLNDLQRIMQQFSSRQPLLVSGNDVKFAYKLARESIVSKVTPHVDPRQAKAAQKEECVICYNDTAAERMFSVDKCRHRFCFHCVKQHVEVKLLHGMVPKCPHDGCKSELVIDACGKLMTPKLIEMWKQRNKENAIPVTERVYCPYPRCSTLMSKTNISESAKSLLSVYPNSGVRRCVECRGLFCVDCKVPWHGKLSCTEYKKLHPNPPADDVKLKSLANNKMWRQCGKCQHMIELTHGCNHITCRCGFEFCYQCGGGWNKKTGTCTKRCPAWNEEYIMRQDPARENLVPNFFAADDDDEDYEDFDYDYENYFQFVHEMMNGYNRAPPPDFDPFFDLPDGVLFTPDMLSPKSRQQLYSDDDSDEAEETGQSHFPHSNAPSFNAPPANHCQQLYSDDDSDEAEETDDDSDDAEETGQSHFPHSNAPSFNAPPPANQCQQLYSDDDSEEAEETGQSHFPHSNAPSFNAPPANQCQQLYSDDDSDGAEEMGESHFPHSNAPSFNASPPANQCQQLYSDDDSYEADETGQSHFPHSNAPSFNAPANQYDENDEYFGKYAIVYDSDGYEI